MKMLDGLKAKIFIIRFIITMQLFINVIDYMFNNYISIDIFCYLIFFSNRITTIKKYQQFFYKSKDNC